MQLVAKPSNDYLTTNPQISYFSTVFRPYTNFAVESVEIQTQSQFDFGNSVVFDIARVGDLVQGLMLEITLPQIKAPKGTKIAWVSKIGNALIKSAKIKIQFGGNDVSANGQSGEFNNVWNELTMPTDKELTHNIMIGQQNVKERIDINGNVKHYYDGLQTFKEEHPETKLCVPLNFWFTSRPEVALPLVASQHINVSLRIDFRHFEELYKLIGFNSNENIILPKMSDCKLFADYIYLDHEERKNLATKPHKYLITCVQQNNEVCTQKENAIQLHFNGNVSELIWTTQEQQVIKPMHVDESVFYSHLSEKETIKYLIQTIASIFYDMGFPLEIGYEIAKYYSIKVSHINTINNWSNYSSLNSKECPLNSATISLNGCERFARRSGMYFNMIQPHTFHTKTPKSNGIFVYSFSLDPENKQPTGACCFDRINDAKLMLSLPMASSENPINVVIYGITYARFVLAHGTAIITI